MNERDLQNRIRLAASDAGYVLWRNNVGMGWTGAEVIKRRDRSVLIVDARPLHAGLCEGSSDLIGLYPRRIVPADVGTIVGQFVAFEVKTDRGVLRAKQATFLRVVADQGGIARVLRDPAEVAS